jgi:hypothetical protein
MSSVCLTENEVQELLEGKLATARVDGVDTHLDACLKCQLLVSAGVRTTSLRTHGLAAESAARLHLEVDQVVAGRYKITRFIARGGMGEVYAAYDEMLGEEIGLKILLRPATSSAAALSRLKAEVQLARRVTDPHVLRVFDIGSYRVADEASGGDASDILFLTMQLLSGETLRQRLRRVGPMPPAEVWRLAGHMFAALGAAHQIGIIHRDFKSDNVMLVPSPDGEARAVVMDFGLAQVATEAPLNEDRTPLIAGTIGYMAPEQLSGGAVTAAADVYAFGVVLHEMLTGVLPPFRPNVARKGAPDVPPSPVLLDKLDIPARWSTLIRRCLARDPAARFHNIIEARAAITGGSGTSRRVIVAAAAAAALATTISVAPWRREPARDSSGGAVSTASAVPTATPPTPPPVAQPAPRPAIQEPEPVAPVATAQPEAALPTSTRTPGRARSRPRPDARPKQPIPDAPRPSPPVPAGADNDEAIDPFRDSR